MILSAKIKSKIRKYFFSKINLILLMGFFFALSHAFGEEAEPAKQKINNIIKHSPQYFHFTGTNFAVNKLEIRAVAAEADTSQNDNKIKKLWQSGDQHFLQLELKSYDHNIEIAVFNLLGKPVLDVFEGKPTSGRIYTIESWRLPNGVYICVVHGNNFRLTKKFVIAR